MTHQDKGGKTALHFAARWGNKEVVDCLLENESDPSISDHMQQTAIDIAKRYAPEIVSLLEKRELNTAFVV